MKWHAFLALTMILSSGAIVSAEEVPNHRSHFSAYRTGAVRTGAVLRVAKKRVSHSLLGNWRPLDSLNEVTADLQKHLPKKQKRCSGTSLIDLPDIDLSWIKLPKLPAHGKSSGHKTEKEHGKQSMKSWLNRFQNPWAPAGSASANSNGNAPVEPPKPVPSSPST
ncbi:MAG: hypothetical protein CMJ59_11505 [Planctomycetaceae bacterium]|nr:hypothetical protein [Planctomycetaceae bacterium]